MYIIAMILKKFERKKDKNMEKKKKVRNAIGIEFNDKEFKEVKEKMKTIKRSPYKDTNKYIYLYGLEKLYQQAKNSIDSE